MGLTDSERAGYDAFVSYAHADDEDGLVSLLQDTLRSIGKPWWKRSALRIFRDETGLAASPALWGSIVAAMDQSAWFVLVASPASARSEWVDKEVAHWLEAKGPGQILPVVIDGEWVWDDSTVDFDLERCSSVPPSLRGAFPQEPRHIDLTWARSELDLTTRTPRWRDDIAEIAAPMHGVAKEELAGADLREHRRTVRIARTAAAVLGVLALVAGAAAVAALRNASTARRNEARAIEAREDAEYRRLIAQSRDLRRSDRELALLLAVEARHLRETPEANGAIQAAILEDPRLLRVTSEPEMSAGYTAGCVLDDQSALTGAGDGTVGLLDLQTGRAAGDRVRLVDRDDETSKNGARMSAITCGAAAGHAVAASADGSVFDLDPRSLATRARWTIEAEVNQVAVSPDGAWIAVGTVDGQALVWPSADPEVEPEVFQESDELSAVGVAFSPDGSWLLTTSRTELLIRDVGTWRRRTSYPSVGDLQSGGVVDLPEQARQVSYDPSGTWILDNRRGVLRVHDASSGEVRWEQITNYVTPVGASFTADGKSVFLIDDTGTWLRRSSDDGTSIGESIRPTDGSSQPISPVPADALHLISSVDARTATWALDGSSAISRAIPSPASRPAAASPQADALAVVPAGPNVISDGRVVDTRTGEDIGAFPTAAFATMLGKTTVGGYFLDRLAVARWDVRDQAFAGPETPVAVEGVVQAHATSAGEIAIGYDDGTIVRVDADGDEIGDPFLRSEIVPDTNVLLSSDGEYLGLSSVSGDNLIVDAATGRQLHEFEASYLSDFSVDRGLVAMMPTVGVAELRNLDTGEVEDTFEVDANAFSVLIEFEAFVFATDSREIQLYDWATKRPVGIPFAGTERPLPFDDGHRVATATAEHIVIWELDPQRWEEAACEMAGRNLTPKERREYLPPASRNGPTCEDHPFDP